MHSQSLSKVAFAGLGAMGFGMASHLVKIGRHVIGFDIYNPSLTRFREAGGQTSNSPREAGKEAKFFICMVTNSQQADSVLFDPENGAVQCKELYNFCPLLCMKDVRFLTSKRSSSRINLTI
jgi:3-hydroxyisobutyrate dehydrogenase-like beta-hydroxyacid dehydrogenase